MKSRVFSHQDWHDIANWTMTIGDCPAWLAVVNWGMYQNPIVRVGYCRGRSYYGLLFIVKYPEPPRTNITICKGHHVDEIPTGRQTSLKNTSYLFDDTSINREDFPVSVLFTGWSSVFCIVQIFEKTFEKHLIYYPIFIVQIFCSLRLKGLWRLLRVAPGRFGMEKEAFAKLPKWKRDNKKKDWAWDRGLGRCPWGCALNPGSPSNELTFPKVLVNQEISSWDQLLLLAPCGLGSGILNLGICVHQGSP